MSESKFKVGDRVRAKDPKYTLHFDCGNDFGIVTHSDIGVVKGKSLLGDDFIEVAFCDGWVCDDFSEEELELVESYDPKTAFLSELKELLKRYNAKLNAWGDETYTTICIAVGDVELYYSYDHYKGGNSFPLTPDNIMDYEKDWAMRIITPGREPKKEVEQTCERCGCVFVYGKEDIALDCYDDDDGCIVAECAVNCPTCGKIIEVEPWSGY